MYIKKQCVIYHTATFRDLTILDLQEGFQTIYHSLKNIAVPSNLKLGSFNNRYIKIEVIESLVVLQMPHAYLS